jgi:hypothetical protein
MGLTKFECTCGTRIWANGRSVWCKTCNKSLTKTFTDIEPAWVGLVSYFRSPEDKGVGDTVQRYAAMLGGEAFKAWSKKLGMPCGCTQRQVEWNAKYPYTEQHDHQPPSDH